MGPVEAGSSSTESINEGRDTSETSLTAETGLLNSDVENVREEDVSEIEAENKMFKVLSKRKNVEKISSAKCFKKGEEFEEKKEPEMSYSSIVLSQTEGISRSYDAEDIKHFLSITKKQKRCDCKGMFP